MMAGYMHPEYAHSLAEFGDPLFLPNCGGWILRRSISGSSAQDAMGCYPLFACRDWSGLYSDLQALRADLVSIALVTDPFGDFTGDDLQGSFDFVLHFKEHYVADLQLSPIQFVAPRHRTYARSALEHITIEICNEPSVYLDDWQTLYQVLIERHSLCGIKAFSPRAFEIQSKIPNSTLFIARLESEIVGAEWYYQHNDIVYNHLNALNALGYQSRAAYALRWSALRHFADKAAWLHLGAGAGIANTKKNGLDQFKRGWSTGTRPVYFCGRIFDREQYVSLCQANGNDQTHYFPAYRAGELA